MTQMSSYLKIFCTRYLEENKTTPSKWFTVATPDPGLLQFVVCKCFWEKLAVNGDSYIKPFLLFVELASPTSIHVVRNRWRKTANGWLQCYNSRQWIVQFFTRWFPFEINIHCPPYPGKGGRSFDFLRQKIMQFLVVYYSVAHIFSYHPYPRESILSVFTEQKFRVGTRTTEIICGNYLLSRKFVQSMLGWHNAVASKSTLTHP
mmetsp:Transcript_15143/g.18169  ORF Transcript_15143/g.18169 Transcript_15143/m.18169 type:complete len:204 (-) Transcript_15143:776-1387(-)